MTDAHTDYAMARIAAALDRIEAQATRPPERPASAGANLVARHEALRETVDESLQELDLLIRGLEG